MILLSKSGSASHSSHPLTSDQVVLLDNCVKCDFGDFDLLSVLKRSTKLLSKLSFHKSSPLLPKNQILPASYRIWIANIDTQSSVIDYLEIGPQPPVVFDDSFLQAFKVKMEKNLSYIIPNVQVVTASNQIFTQPKLITGNFSTSTGSQFHSLSLLCYDTGNVEFDVAEDDADDAPTGCMNSSVAHSQEQSKSSSVKTPVVSKPASSDDNTNKMPPPPSSLNSKFGSTFRMTSELFSSMLTAFDSTANGQSKGGKMSSDSSQGKSMKKTLRSQDIVYAIPKGLSIICNRNIDFLRHFIANRFLKENCVNINPADLKEEVALFMTRDNPDALDSKAVQNQQSYLLHNALKFETIIFIVIATLLECKIVLWSKTSGSFQSIIISWLQDILSPLVWCHPCASSIHADTLKQLENCPTPFLFGIHATSLDFNDNDCLVVDVDSSICLQFPTIFKRVKSTIDRFCEKIALQMGSSVFNCDSISTLSPWNRKSSSSSTEAIAMHWHIDFHIKTTISNLLKFVKVSCLTAVHEPRRDYLEVIFNESVYYRLLQREGTKLEKSAHDSVFFDLLIRTQLFSNLICSYSLKDIEVIATTSSAGATSDLTVTTTTADPIMHVTADSCLVQTDKSTLEPSAKQPEEPVDKLVNADATLPSSQEEDVGMQGPIEAIVESVAI